MKGSMLLVCVHKPQFLLRWQVSGEGEGALLGVVGRLQKCLLHFLVAWLKYFCFWFALSALCCFSPPTRSQVQKVLQFHRELPREELHAAPTNRAAAEAPLHPRPAQRAAGPHTAQRPHRPDEEKEGRERCVCFSIIMKGWKSVGCISCEWLVFVLVQMRRNMSTVAVRRRKRILLSKKESPGMFYTCSISLKGNKCTCSGGGVSQSSNLLSLSYTDTAQLSTCQVNLLYGVTSSACSRRTRRGLRRSVTSSSSRSSNSGSKRSTSANYWQRGRNVSSNRRSREGG